MDRFAMRFSLGYVSVDEEIAILEAQQDGHPVDTLKTCLDRGSVMALRQAVQRVRVSAEMKRYLVELVASTRGAEGVALGASPRASLTLMKAAQALALFDGLDFISPEQVQELAVAVIAHRLKLDTQAEFGGLTVAQVVEDILRRTPAPV